MYRPAASNPNDAFCSTWSEHAGTPVVSRHTRQWSRRRESKVVFQATCRGEDADKKLTSVEPLAAHVVVRMANSPDVALVSCSGIASGTVVSTVTSNGAVELNPSSFSACTSKRISVRFSSCVRGSLTESGSHALSSGLSHGQATPELISTRVALPACTH